MIAVKVSHKKAQNHTSFSAACVLLCDFLRTLMRRPVSEHSLRYCNAERRSGARIRPSAVSDLHRSGGAKDARTTVPDYARQNASDQPPLYRDKLPPA